MAAAIHPVLAAFWLQAGASKLSARNTIICPAPKGKLYGQQNTLQSDGWHSRLLCH